MWAVEAGLGEGRQSEEDAVPAPDHNRPWDSLPDEAMTPLKWNSWVRVRRTDVYGKTPRALTSSRAPRTRKEAGVLHSSLPRSIPGADARARGGHARRCRPHTPPPHLNTISQDVETISILEGVKRDWPTDSSVWIGPLQDCRSGLCGWGAVWSPWPGMETTMSLSLSWTQSIL